MPHLKVKLLAEALPPVYNHPGDAGMDLPLLEDATVGGHSFLNLRTGIFLELPEGYWAMLVGRSSTLRKRGLLVVQGIIDNGYRGELFVMVQNLGFHTVELKRGERLAQLILMPLCQLPVAFVPNLSSSSRGERGFGSTGA